VTASVVSATVTAAAVVAAVVAGLGFLGSPAVVTWLGGAGDGATGGPGDLGGGHGGTARGCRPGGRRCGGGWRGLAVVVVDGGLVALAGGGVVAGEGPRRGTAATAGQQGGEEQGDGC
jgi:hypothetical protein